MKRMDKTALRAVLAVGTLALTSFSHAVAGAKFVYVANQNNQAVRAFAVNPDSGALSVVQGGPWIADEFPLSMASTPGGKVIYTVNASSQDISAFDTTNGALVPVSGGPFPTTMGACCVGMVVHPSGKFAYGNERGNGGSYGIWPFVVNDNGSLVASGNPAQAGVNPTMTIDPSGRFLYAVNAGLPFFNDPAHTDNISAFTIDASGALTEVGPPVATGSNCQRLAVDRQSKYLLVSCNSSKQIRTYSINSSTGALRQVGAVSTSGLPFDIRFEPSGRYVYVGMSGPNRVSVYSLNGTSGALTKIQDVNSTWIPGRFGADPSGKFMFETATVPVTSRFGTTFNTSIITYKIGTDGKLTQSGQFVADPETGIVGIEVAGTP